MIMILCVNPNAAIDKTVIVNSFEIGQIHRPEAVTALPGGKGCNVARTLKILGETPVVTGWIGGSAGQFIENGLREEGIQTDFVQTPFESRTCLSILDNVRHVITEIYENGEPLLAEHITAMREHFRAIVGHFNAVTFSGSLPPGVPLDFYADLIRIANKAGVRTFLDSSKDALKYGLEAKPFLAKSNEDEVSVLVGDKLKTRAEFASAAAEIASRYETIVVLSMGANGAIAADGRGVVHVQNPKVEAKSAVGSGDCTLAGLAYGFTHGFTWEKALIHGIAAGTANTLQVGAGNFATSDFEQVQAQIRVTRFEIS
jgi:tagatose 6-phosphate kinase